MGAFGTGTFGLGTFGGAPPAVYAGDAVFLMEENVGFDSVPSIGNSTILMEENVGFDSVPSIGNSAVLMEENIGFEPPPTVLLSKPQIGWGIPVVPTIQTTMVLESANPTIAMFENVT